MPAVPQLDAATIAAAANGSPQGSRPVLRTKVAYLMAQFPKLTETFVLYEILAVERHGIDVEIYPLRRGKDTVAHPEAARLVARTRFLPWFSLSMVLSHLHFLARRPQVYLSTLARLLWANLGSLRYFAGAVVFFPKAVHIARLIQCAKVAHVHAHFASHPAAVAWVISRLTGIPYSFTAHGSDLHRDRHMLREKVAEAKFVVTISSYNRDLIVAECGDRFRHTTKVIRCGVDPAVFSSAVFTADGERPADGSDRIVRILCVGTLHEVKGQAYLIEACRQLQQVGHAVECHFAGNGPDLKRLTRQAARSGIADQVHFHGACPRTKIVELLRQVDLVAAPSVQARDGRREGIPVVLMEAMASQRPVVASRLSGIPELVIDGETGLLTPPRDAAALAAAIARLIDDRPLGRRLARAGREKVLRDFHLDRNAARLARWLGQGRTA